MYGMVLMAAMSGSADVTEIGHHNRGGCNGSVASYGGCTGSGAVVGGGCYGSGAVMGGAGSAKLSAASGCALPQFDVGT